MKFHDLNIPALHYMRDVDLRILAKNWRTWLTAHVGEGRKRDVLLAAVKRLEKRCRVATKRKPRR